MAAVFYKSDVRLMFGVPLDPYKSLYTINRGLDIYILSVPKLKVQNGGRFLILLTLDSWY